MENMDPRVNSKPATNLETLFSELKSNPDEYKLKIYDETGGKKDPALEALRVTARSAFGSTNITALQPNSPFDTLCKGQNVALKDRNNRLFSITTEQLQNCQNNLQVIYYDDRISKNNIKRIQEIKANSNATNLRKAEKKELARLASYYLIRGEAYQYLDEEGHALKVPLKRIFYYACFPNLEQTDTLDYLEFVDTDTKEIKTDKEPAYKNKVKATLRLMLEMANRNKEALDVVTPSAFFYGLSEQGQQRGKQLFIDAAIELLNEEGVNESYPNVPVVFLHSNAADRSTRIPVHINHGDASGPQRAAIKVNLGFQVAEAIMSNPLHPVGNGALGDRAASAKEENDTRKCPTIPLVFSSRFNTQMLGKIDQATPFFDFINNNKISKEELAYLDIMIEELHQSNQDVIAKLYDRYMRIAADNYELLELYEDILLRYLDIPIKKIGEAKEQKKGFFYRWFGSTAREDGPIHKLIKQEIDLKHVAASKLVDKLKLTTNAAVMKALFNNNSIGAYAKQVELILKCQIPQWMFDLRNSMYSYLKKYPEASFLHSRQARATHLADFMTRQILAYSQANSENDKKAVLQTTVDHLRKHQNSLQGQKGEMVESIAAALLQTNGTAGKTKSGVEAVDPYQKEISQLTVKETSYFDNAKVTPAMMDPTLKKHKDMLEEILKNSPMLRGTTIQTEHGEIAREYAGFKLSFQSILQRKQHPLKTYLELEVLLRDVIDTCTSKIDDLKRTNSATEPQLKKCSEDLNKLEKIGILASFSGIEPCTYKDLSIFDNAATQSRQKFDLFAIGGKMKPVPSLNESTFKQFLVCVSPQNQFESVADQNLRTAFNKAKIQNMNTELGFYIENKREKHGEYVLKSRDVEYKEENDKPLNKITSPYQKSTL